MSVLDNLQIKNTSASGSGKSLHLINSARGKFKDLKIFGESTQAAEPTLDSPQEIKSVVLSKIRSCRKNLLRNNAENATKSGVTFTVNSDKIITVNGTATDSFNYYICQNLKLQGNTQYRIGGCTGGSTSTHRMVVSHSDGTTAVVNYDSPKIFTTLSDGIVTVRIGIASGAELNNVVFKPIIVEYSETDLTYEPYTESVVTMSETITLNGLEDVQDYIDIKENIEHYEVEEVVFDGADAENWQMQSGENYFQFYIHIPNAFNSETAICSHFSPMKISERGKKTGFINYPDNTFRFALLPDLNITTISKWKEWLSNNPVIVKYRLAEPTETPLNAEDLAALNALETFCPVTNVFNDANAEMYAECFKNNNIGQDIADVHAIAADSHVLVAKAQATAENAQETATNAQDALASCLYIVSFNAESGELVTRSADYKG